MQRIRPAIERLDTGLGLAHALASRRLYTDGAEVLYDYATSGDDEEAAVAARELVAVRDGQHVFNDVVDDYAATIRLPAYEFAELIVEPSRGFGQPIFLRGGLGWTTRWRCSGPVSPSMSSPRSTGYVAISSRTPCVSRLGPRPDMTLAARLADLDGAAVVPAGPVRFVRTER